MADIWNGAGNVARTCPAALLYDNGTFISLKRPKALNEWNRVIRVRITPIAPKKSPPADRGGR